ncbi:DUF5789 family protein [Halobacteriales archaeon Cl-PHB]
MADNDEESEDEPAVELGEGPDVEGAPISRVAARLTWGIEQSAVVAREGDTEIRTPDGPQELGDVLEAVDEPYFATRQEFVQAIEDEVGTGPVATE